MEISGPEYGVTHFGGAPVWKHIAGKIEHNIKKYQNVQHSWDMYDIDLEPPTPDKKHPTLVVH